MNLVTYKPWSVVDLLHRDFDRSRSRPFGPASNDNAVGEWLPAVDIVEEKDRFVVRADVPGVDPADIDVNMNAGVLSVSGERRAETRDEADGVARVESVNGRFIRRFTLPESADSDGIKAKSANGILEISIPKQAAVQPRRITVEAA